MGLIWYVNMNKWKIHDMTDRQSPIDIIELNNK